MSRRGTRALVVFVAAVTTIMPAFAPAQPRPDPMQEMTAKINDAAAKINRVRQLKGKKVAVGEFRMVDNKTTELAALIANLLEVALSNQADLELVSRSDLCQVIRENKLWVSDQFDPQAAKKMGNFSQADFIVPGRVTALDRVAQVTFRVVDTETTRSVFADAISIPLSDSLLKKGSLPVAGDGCDDAKGGQDTAKAGPDTTAASSKAIPALTSPPSPADANRLQVKVWTEKTVYRVGEPLRISVRVNRDAYITLVDLGTSGAVTVLYPNRFHQNNFVRGAQDVMIPPPEAEFTLAVQGPKGFEQIRAIATEQPVSFVPSYFSNPNVAFRSLDRNQSRNISLEKKQVAPTKWAEDVIALEIEP